MKVDDALIEAVAKNARLTLTPDERKRFAKEFKEILDAFSIIASAPVADEASTHPFPIQDVTRDDKPKPCLTQEQALANTQHKKDGYFKGPKAL
jgi:aspartyl-tRNA(Asn)/glutamyl-tRNA(Gln) amidotransferase subunit C